MSQGPRVLVGTQRALYRLAAGTCYFPDCAQPVLRVVAGDPIVDLEIAHIKGEKPKSARYEASMTDDERSHFDNLILLCTAHHKVIDRIHPERYPVDLLLRWKRDNEPAGGLSVLAMQDRLTDANLEQMIEAAVSRFGPIRRAEIDLLAGVAVTQGDVLTGPFGDAGSLLWATPEFRGSPRLVCVNIRNTGPSPISIDGVDFCFGLMQDGEELPAPATLLGRNDFPAQNPPLPYVVGEGEAVRWFMDPATLAAIATTIPREQISGMFASVRLSSGETVLSQRVPFAAVAP